MMHDAAAAAEAAAAAALAGYQHRGKKKQWRKSDPLITTIVQGAQLLCIPCHSKATATIMLRQQHMPTASHSCAGARVFHILGVIIMTNDNQLDAMAIKQQ